MPLIYIKKRRIEKKEAFLLFPLRKPNRPLPRRVVTYYTWQTTLLLLGMTTTIFVVVVSLWCVVSYFKVASLIIIHH